MLGMRVRTTRTRQHQSTLNVSTGVVVETNGAGTVTGSHVYNIIGTFRDRYSDTITVVSNRQLHRERRQFRPLPSAKLTTCEDPAIIRPGVLHDTDPAADS